jgi:hypothetical protein
MSSNDLLTIIENEFSIDEIKIFIKHYRIYDKYDVNCEDYVIKFDDIWKLLGFKRKIHGKRILFKYFEINNDYIFSANEFNDNVIMLKINTYKTFSMVANTEKSKLIRNYYNKFQAILFEYYKNESQYIVEKFEKICQNKEDNIIDTKMINNQNELIELYNMKRIIFTIKMETFENGNYIIKIGQTNNIKEFMNNTTYILLDVFECENNIEFEKYIHTNIKLLKTLKYNELVDTYLMSNDETYKRVKNNILRYILPFKSKSIEETKIDLEISKYNLYLELVKIYKDDVEKIKNIMSNLSSNQEIKNIKESDENQIIKKNDANIASTSAASTSTEPRINQYSPMIQLYDGTDITKLIRTFPSITEATREIENSSYTAIKIAAKNKLLYLGYRWHFINRNSPDINNAVPIGVTSTSQTRNTGYIAMTNIDNNKIEKVFLNQKSASEYIQQHPSAISQCIKFMKPLSGHNWHFWKDLDSNLQDSYLEDFELPKPEPPPRGFKVEKECTETGTITQYGSMSEAVKINRLSVNTIKKSITTGEAYKSYIWRSV